MNTSIADAIDSLIPHLQARDVTLIAVSGAPIEKLLATGSGWGGGSTGHRATGAISTLTWVSRAAWRRRARRSSRGSTSCRRSRFRNARGSGTDIFGYLTELFGFTAFALEDGTVYQTYSTTGRGVEFLMPYYGFLDRAPKGRDEDDGFQLWIRRHDEYDRPRHEWSRERSAPSARCRAGRR